MTARMERTVELLRTLVGFPSVSAGSNVKIADFVSQHLADLGAEVDLFTYANEQKVNVVARFGPEPEDGDAIRDGLVLCGHLDVVPADEPEWEGNPFTLIERDGKLFGRGSCDMKASIANLLAIVEELDQSKLTSPLVVLLTADEELGAVGVQQLAEVWSNDGIPRDPIPEACIIGEPTSLRAVRMHKGHLKVRITVRGKAAHSGSPHLGVNAIERSVGVLAALSHLRAEWEAARPAHHEIFPEVPYAVLCPARIRGGEAWNVIPEKVVIECGVRLMPGMMSDDAVAKMQRSIAKQIDNATAFELEIVNDNPPLLTSEDAPLHRALCAEIGQRDSVGVSYASDGGPLARDFDMECVLFGPGSIEVAHRPNEFVPLDELMAAQRVVRRMIERLCME